MKKFAVMAMAAVAFLSTLDSSEAQVLRRFRSNVREAISPQTLPQQPQLRLQPGTSAQPQYVQPQVSTQRPAPGRIPSGQQQLTPYSRLTPQQRTSVPQQRTPIPQQRVSVPQGQPSNGPKLNAPTPVRNPIVQPADTRQVRIVTYRDPRTGRTFQRRYLLPPTPPAAASRPTKGQITTGRSSIFNQPTTAPVAVAAPRPTPSTGPSLVPPIQFAPQSTQPPVNVAPALSPALAGPVLAAPTTVAQPIAASIDNSAVITQVETASAELEVAAPSIETTTTGIPDLSGITVDPAPLEPAPMESAEDEDQALFFDDDSLDTSADETTYCH